jgi:hypothetical protein
MECVLKNSLRKNKVHEGALIAIPTADGETVFPGMLGRAGKFFIFEMDTENSIRLKEKRENPMRKACNT